MLNWTLYKKGMKSNLLIIVIFMAILTLYTSVMVSMYNPTAMKTLNDFFNTMPQIMKMVGMTAGSTTLLGFLTTYLYGFIYLVFPLIFSILCANKLVAKYVDNTSMSSLVAAPVKRSTIIFTQIKVLLTGVFILIAYSTLLEIIISQATFPGDLDIPRLLILNLGLLALHMFLASICFIFSCVFSDTKNSIGWGAGIPALMFVLQMMANAGGNAANAKYFTAFTLFNPTEIVAWTPFYLWAIGILAFASIVIYFASVEIFVAKDLNI